MGGTLLAVTDYEFHPEVWLLVGATIALGVYSVRSIGPPSFDSMSSRRHCAEAMRFARGSPPAISRSSSKRGWTTSNDPLVLQSSNLVFRFAQNPRQDIVGVFT